MYCTSVLPSKHICPWYDNIKRKLNVLQQRYDSLKETSSARSSQSDDKCFIICNQRTSRRSITGNHFIEKKLIPDVEIHEFNSRYLTTKEVFHDGNIGNVFVIPYNLALYLRSSKHFNVKPLVIIVVTNTNEYENATKLFENIPKAKVTLLTDLEQTASLTLEQAMFKPMKTNAEALDHIMHLEQKRQARLKAKDQVGSMSTRKKVFKRSGRNYFKAKTKQKVCKRRSKTQTKRQNEKKVSKTWKIAKKKLLRNSSHGHQSTDMIVRSKIPTRGNKHLEVAENNGCREDSVKCLYNEIMGMFNRSRLPEEDKPNIIADLYRKIDDQVSNELFKIDSSVKSCGYRYSTLQVFVDDTSNPKINNSIRTVLEQYDIYDFEIVPSIATYKPLFRVGSKAKPNPDADSYGTVGGFAQKDSKDTCALISRHVAIHSINNKVVISDCNSSISSSLITETVPMEHDEPVLDISATLIHPSDTSKCETNFRSEDGVPMAGMPCTYDEKKLYNRPVHLWGATTAPGRGIITIPELRDRKHDKTFIVVENRVGSSDRVCQKGDSGAMVCADDDYGSGVEVISMLVGVDQNNPGKYATLRIDHGLEQLEKQTKSKFKLISN